MNIDNSNKHFCILPWIHFSLGPSGEVHSCCRTDYKSSFGSLKNSSLEEIWNSDAFKRFRLDMLNNEKISSCQDCYNIEKIGVESFRQISDRDWKDQFYRIDDMNSDGSLKHFEPIYLDLRFSNICNFKCRTCGPDYSTSWYSDNIELGMSNFKPDFSNNEKSEQLWEELIKILPKIRKIYFAGGEPLLQKDHYRLLDELIKLNHLDVQLLYNTNLSNLSFSNKNILDYWKKFKNVAVSASLDGIEKKGEYIRKGLVWNDFYENRKTIEQNTPHVIFKIFWTLSVLNCFHLVEAMRFMIEKKFLKSGEELEINILNSPSIYNIGILNDQERESLKKEYAIFTKKYLTLAQFPNKDFFEKNLNYILDYLENSHFESERKNFWAFNRKLDKVRSEKMELLFPELKALLAIPFE